MRAKRSKARVFGGGAAGAVQLKSPLHSKGPLVLDEFVMAFPSLNLFYYDVGIHWRLLALLALYTQCASFLFFPNS